MSKKQSMRVVEVGSPERRRFTEEFKAEAVQMLLDGHAASSICQRLGLSSPMIKRRACEASHGVAIRSSNRFVIHARREAYVSGGRLSRRRYSRIASAKSRRSFIAKAGQCSPGDLYFSKCSRSRSKCTKHICRSAQSIAL